MHVLQHGIKLAVLACLALAPAACANRQAEAALELSEEKRALSCRMERLNQQNDSLWNEVAASLGRALPSGMPPDERRNMIGVRNADLIRMFQSFPALDTAIRNKVMAAGEQDKKTAAEMRAVMDELAAAEQQLAVALGELQKKDRSKYEKIKQQLLEKERVPCW